MTSLTEAAPAAAPVAEAERIHSLDILRGVALLGMLLVHFRDFSADGSGWTAGLLWVIGVFAAEKFYALFAFLFGVGFAVQLRRAEQKGVAFVPLYLKRVAGLAVFGFAAHALLGFNVLLGYALFAIPLLVVRRWSTRALLALALSLTLGWMAYNLGLGAYHWLTLGAEGADAAWAARWAPAGEAWRAVSEARAQESYAALIAARLRHMAWFYVQPFMLIPNDLALFVFGFLALRHGVFDDPRRHTRLIVVAIALGVTAWATHTWLLPRVPEFGPDGVVNPIRYSSRLGQWLMFGYAGGLLLLVTYRARWVGRLAPFAWAGRMALSNYLLQILTIDVLVSAYGFGLGDFPPAAIVPATLLFFAAQVALSRWWLGRFRFGPAEWLWRSATYGRMQPMRRMVEQRATVAGQGSRAMRGGADGA